jgi:hypothetical protein
MKEKVSQNALEREDEGVEADDGDASVAEESKDDIHQESGQEDKGWAEKNSRNDGQVHMVGDRHNFDRGTQDHHRGHHAQQREPPGKILFGPDSEKKEPEGHRQEQP